MFFINDSCQWDGKLSICNFKLRKWCLLSAQIMITSHLGHQHHNVRSINSILTFLEPSHFTRSANKTLSCFTMYIIIIRTPFISDDFIYTTQQQKTLNVTYRAFGRSSADVASWNPSRITSSCFTTYIIIFWPIVRQQFAY